MPPQKLPAELPAAFTFHRPHINTDSIDMEFVLQEIDESLRSAVIAATYETVAAVHTALAEGATKVAKIIGGAPQKQR